MGLPHSGPLSDACLWHLAERGVVGNAELMNKFGIQAYYRFKDDVFVWARGGHHAAHFLHMVIQRASAVYDITVTGASHSGLEFLSIQVEFVAGGGFRTEPVIKKNGPPLATTSAHAPGVTWWPVNHLRNLRQLCSDGEAYHHMKQQYLEVFVEHGAPKYLIQALRMVIFHEVVRERKNVLRPPCAEEIWAVLPFHPACKLVPMHGRIAQFVMDPSWRAAYAEAMGRDPPIITIAWANVLPTFASRLRSAALQLNDV